MFSVVGWKMFNLEEDLERAKMYIYATILNKIPQWIIMTKYKLRGSKISI